MNPDQMTSSGSSVKNLGYAGTGLSETSPFFDKLCQ